MTNLIVVQLSGIGTFLLILLAAIRRAEAAGNSPHDGGVGTIFTDEDFFMQQDRKSCSIYLAPSKIGGWGVYAARYFAKYELVEIAPRFLPMDEKWLKQSVLNDYYYGYLWQGNKTVDNFGAAVLGMTMFYNHGAGKKRNVMYTNIGHEPTHEFPMYAQVLAFTALREIKRGEELLSSYGDEFWFVARGLSMAKGPPPEVLTQAEIEAREGRYCSKVFSGQGQATFVERALPAQIYVGDPLPQYAYDKYLPIQDYPTAVAKESVQAGQILEMAPALVVPFDVLRQSPLAPMAIFWSDWNDEQREMLLQLITAGSLRMRTTSRNKRSVLIKYDSLQDREQVVILPIAGNLGMIEKVGRNNGESNCRLEVVASTSLEDSKDDNGSAGLVLKVIATTGIRPGESLRLDLPDSSTWHEKAHLLQLLASTGQPIPKYIADSRDYVPRAQDENYYGNGGEDEL